MRKLVITLAAISAPIVLVVFVIPYVTSDPSVGKRTYVGENAKVLRRLPVFPGALELRRAVTPVRSSNVETGWMTTVTYRLPAQAQPPQVDAFYRERLRTWRTRPLRRPGGVPGSPARTRFRRGDELVVLRTGGVGAERRTFDVGVDYSTDVE